MIRIGCSGWNYRDWRGRFYPEKMAAKNWFAFYAEQFDTVEINNSFYRLPSPETVDKWREQAPSGFCYAAKANRYLTQMKKLKDCEEPLERMMASFAHFGDSLGPVLYQLPPHFTLDLPRLEDFLRIAPRHPVPVFEFRHPSWYVDEVYALLERHGAAFCVHDMPGSASPRLAVGTTAYVRFHGTKGKYRGGYSRERLEDWAEWMKAQSREGRTVWAYFNNDYDAQAITDARILREAIGSGN
ncbi:DUF72 domain-containing protein [Sphingobium indicum]|uniref:DUF72 domain-containing protein n=3 Tax=Sphingobium indicum TaxID=332055 RepID=A0A1L5BNQ4_SPHIB|nr:DUF72 domain-containing protein [Sphingobium indicum]APL94402.1 hypothetical protein SIDU_07720 [Sphingobium indicum B90A]KEZ00281.1 hypothetical protein AI27_07390 [Sphingomonas sp. BHC-A]RYM04142.1 DUF72 domain-containing protein [Sphingobium indicum]